MVEPPKTKDEMGVPDSSLSLSLNDFSNEKSEIQLSSGSGIQQQLVLESFARKKVRSDHARNSRTRFDIVKTTHE